MLDRNKFVIKERVKILSSVQTYDVLDAETGRQLRVDTHDDTLRARFAAAAAEERATLARTLGSAGVRHLVLSTSGDWLRPLAAFLRRRER